MARLVEVTAGGQRSPWQKIGLTCSDSSCRVADVTVRFDPDTTGITAWTFQTDRDAQVSIDGIPTTLVASAPHTEGEGRIGDQRMVSFDHVVVFTDDIDRTCSAITRELGLEVRRERLLDDGGVQRFHKLDNTIIEVVSGPRVRVQGASLWGFVVTVDDLFEYCGQAGEDIVSPPRKAVQPGRWISTVRDSVGLGVALALMTPHVPAT